MSKDSTWLEIELLRERHHWLPWQPDLEKGQTEEDCEDPERLVVFDDIKPVIFNVSKPFHYQLVLGFLEFLDVRSEKQSSIFKTFLENLEEYPDYLWKSGFKQGVLEYGKDVSVKEMAVNFVQQVLPYFTKKQNTALTLYLVDIQLSAYGSRDNLSKFDKKEMRKVLKNILKEEQNRNNLAIWCAYIDLERCIGKPGEAQGIVETALSMYGGKCITEETSENVNGLISLYCLYCETLLNISPNVPKSLLPKVKPVSGDVKKAVMSALAKMLNAETFTPKFNPDHLKGAVILKLSASFSKHVGALYVSLKENSGDETVLEKLQKLCWCYSLFSYCSSGLETALKVYKDVIDNVENTTDEHALVSCVKHLHLDKLRLILYHMSVTSSPLSLLRKHLDLALKKFPEDEVLLSLFVDIEKKSRITGNLYRCFDRWCRVVEHPQCALIAVNHQCEFLQELRTEGLPKTLVIDCLSCM